MNKFAILLTTCVSPLYCSKRDCENRRKLYVKVIKKWLRETSFEIYCVDSSNFQFEEIKNPRYHLVSFLFKNKDINLGKTEGETKSILYAYKKFKKDWNIKKFTHVIKITGRYYLESLEKWTKNKSSSKRDIWTQQDRLTLIEKIKIELRGMDYEINSEIFICRISKLYKIFHNKNKKIIMERFLYLIIESDKYKHGKLPRLKNTLNSRRGGDNLLVEYL